MIRSTTTLWALSLLFFSLNAFADARRDRLDANSQFMDAEVKKAQEPNSSLSKERRSHRRLASVEPSEAASMQVEKGIRPHRSPKNLIARMSLGVGYGVSSGSEVDQAADLGVSSDKGVTFTLGVDLSFYKYFGLDIEGSSGLKATQSSSVNADTPFTEIRQRTISSLMTNVKFQVPFRAGSFVLIPKAGIGWATSSIKDGKRFSDAPGSETISTTTKVNAPYFVLGLDARPHRRWLVSFDFAKTVKGSGNLGSSASPDSSVPLRDVGLNRIRASAAYRLTNQWAVGAEFARRSIGSSMTLSDGSQFSSTVNQSQFLGLVQLDL